MQRDSLDFKSMSVEKLFTKLLVPTIMGMAASALFTVVDGIFVGNGIGSDAMAAVNISRPIFYDYYRSRIDVRHGRRDTHFHQLVAG